MSDKKSVTIYTDGGCDPNPGPGGFGAVLLFGNHRRELSGGYCLTTNNRMEILAAITGLEALKHPCRVTLYSDSRYVVDAIEKGWAESWRSKGWRKGDKKPAKNPDLWERLLDLVELHDVEFRWVPGHSGVPENERCDELATEALRKDDLPPDPGYESEEEEEEPPW
ncbi:MAG: ribonuclease HI [Candidatus Wallbacteria bacterium]|nr:ribonuclease HI [Candidatus Wallbacteria bacterium]MBI4868475.1 ribonuclease HI [Candidatus Wallbacteria bacterium]